MSLRTLIFPRLTIATPAESYPLYSTFLNPLTKSGATLSSAIQATIPHIFSFWGLFCRLIRALGGLFLLCKMELLWFNSVRCRILAKISDLAKFINTRQAVPHRDPAEAPRVRRSR